MSGVDAVHAAFQDLREHCDPQGHDLLAALEELCLEAVIGSRTIQAYVATLEHEARVAELINEYGIHPVRVQHLRGVS